MTPEIRILHLEDDPADARLVRAALAAAGLKAEVTVVESREGFLAAFERERFDLILADYRLSGFTGLEALAHVRDISKDLPFIFVSGAMGDETAVETLKSGATDYLLKDRLHRLAPAINRALAEMAAKVHRKRTEHELRESEQRAAMAANAAKVGLFEWNVATDQMQWTVQHDLIFGYPPSGPTTATTRHAYKDWADRVHRDDLDWVGERLRRSVAEREPFEADYRIVWPDRSIHWIATRGQVVCEAEDRSVRMMGTVMDITDRKLSEEELREAKDQLEQRVRERTAELSQTVMTLQEEVSDRLKAEEALRERSAMLQALAAELTLTEQRERQRLSQVLHDGLQQILVGAKFRLDKMQRIQPKDMKRALAEVMELVDDAIETARSLTAELSPTILCAGLVPALEWLARRMQDKHGLMLDLDAEPHTEPATEDARVLLFQAVRELLFNVIKHAGVRQASVHVRQQDDQIRVTVEDGGLGFDPAQLRTTGRLEGIGLFSIGERLKLIGGRLEIDSTPGHGSRITLSAPASEPEEETVTKGSAAISLGVFSQRLSSPAGAETRTRILLVDDHAVVRQGLARLIQEAPDMVIVGEASDGKTAVRLAREVKPDIVLMDINMPCMDGLEATKIIHSELPDVRIIGLSVFESQEQAAAMLAAGAVSYVTKSGPSSVLLESIHAFSRAPRTNEMRTPEADRYRSKIEPSALH